MEHLPTPLSRVESDAMITRMEKHFERHSFGAWAVEIPGVTPFAGFIGLFVPRFDAHFTPCVEIGWRLDEPYWGHGYATEGALAVTTFGFNVLHLNEIVSFTVPSKHEITPCHGKDWHDAYSRRRLRSSISACGTPTTTTRTLPARSRCAAQLWVAPDVALASLGTTRLMRGLRYRCPPTNRASHASTSLAAIPENFPSDKTLRCPSCEPP